MHTPRAAGHPRARPSLPRRSTQAYEILANPELKMLYDMGGMEAVRDYNKEEAGGGGGGGGMMDMFFGGGGGGGKSRNSKKGPDAEIGLEVSLGK